MVGRRSLSPLLHLAAFLQPAGHALDIEVAPHIVGHHVGIGGGVEIGDDLFGGREVEIRWSSFALPDTPNHLRNRVIYCIAQINNVWRNPKEDGKERWVAYPKPQAVMQYYDGMTGDLLYAESILATK